MRGGCGGWGGVDGGGSEEGAEVDELLGEVLVSG